MVEIYNDIVKTLEDIQKDLVDQYAINNVSLAIDIVKIYADSKKKKSDGWFSVKEALPPEFAKVEIKFYNDTTDQLEVAQDRMVNGKWVMTSILNKVVVVAWRPISGDDTVD